jgi:hypothetical protein
MTETDPWASPAPEGTVPLMTATVRQVGAAEPTLPYDEPTALVAAMRYTDAVQALQAATAALDEAWLVAGPYLVDTRQADVVVGLDERIAEARRKLAEHRAIVARDCGRAGTFPLEGRLPDGRPYQIAQGNSRTAWEHDRWKADVARELTSNWEGCQVVKPTTGEVFDAPTVLGSLVSAAQEVHGSTGPRVKALRTLGLSAEDYSERTPGPWSISVEDQ